MRCDGFYNRDSIDTRDILCDAVCWEGNYYDLYIPVHFTFTHCPYQRHRLVASSGIRQVSHSQVLSVQDRTTIYCPFGESWKGKLAFHCFNHSSPYVTIIGTLRYGDYGLRTTAGWALCFVCSTGSSRGLQTEDYVREQRRRGKQHAKILLFSCSVHKNASVLHVILSLE